jgi:hypothetical protein
MRYEVVKSRETPDVWHVEATNEDGDGEMYVAVFSGPGAEARAVEYAEFKNSQPAAAPGPERSSSRV